MRKLFRKARHYLRLWTLEPVTRAILKDSLTYLSTTKLRRIEIAINSTRKVEGDLVEFGVALGGSGIMIAQSSSPTRRFHGFDVFSMIPPPNSDKDDNKSKERYAVIAAGQSVGIGNEQYYGYRADLLEEVTASFAKHGVPVDGARVSLHKGLFENTWHSSGICKIALAHIDCDWYDPVTFCLDACADRLCDGGVIVIDDYSDYGGCRIAVDEFLVRRPDFQMELGANPYLRKRDS